jgi:hypothetical protein
MRALFFGFLIMPVLAGCYKSQDAVEYKLEVYGIALKAPDGTSRVLVEDYLLMKAPDEDNFTPVWRASSLMASFGNVSIPMFAAQVVAYDLFGNPGPFTSSPVPVFVNDRPLVRDALSYLLMDGGEGLAERGDGKVILECRESECASLIAGGEWSFSSEVKMPGTLILLSPADGEHYPSGTPVEVRWDPAADADFYSIWAFDADSPTASATGVFLESSARETSFDLSGTYTLVALAANGFSPGPGDPAAIVEALQNAETNVTGVDDGMFLAISASSPVTVTVE